MIVNIFHMTAGNHSDDKGGPLSSGWHALVCELLVEEISKSQAFWCDVLGFRVGYERESEKFVYLERQLKDGRGAQVMLCQRSGRWETGPMTPPLGQGVMFQICVDDISSLQDALACANWPIHSSLRDIWRTVGDREQGQREIFVLDPDGYLLMLYQALGERPAQN